MPLATWARLVRRLIAAGGLGAQAQVYLALRMAVEALEKAAEERPVFVGLSISLGAMLPRARENIGRLRSRVPGVRVMVGGRAVAALEHPGRVLPVDGWARSASGAVDVARRWKPVG